MKIFIMRHGEAEVMAKTDKARRLTEYGKKQAFAQGLWLAKQLNSTALERVLVSPYQRAQETFEQVNLVATRNLGRYYALRQRRIGGGLSFRIGKRGNEKYFAHFSFAVSRRDRRRALRQA